MALKVPEARTQCPTIIVFTTPVGFGERDTHLWASMLQNLYPFREKSFPPSDLSPNDFLFSSEIMSSPDLQPRVGAAHSILGILSSIAIGCNKLHSLQQSNSTDTTKVPKLTGHSPCTHKFLTAHRPQAPHTQLHVNARGGGGIRFAPFGRSGAGRGGPRPACLVLQLAGSCSIILKLSPTHSA